MTETEKFVEVALAQMAMGNDGDETYHPLYKAWRSFREEPSQLQSIENYGRYGMGLMIFLSFETISDIDIKQQIASIAYLFVSKALKANPSINYYKNRVLLMITNHEAFEYTVSSVVNKDEGWYMMSLNPFKARDAMYKMEFADLSAKSGLLSIDMLNSKYYDLKNKILSNFFGPNKTEQSIINEGNRLHEDILEYIENKVLVNNDIDF